MSIQQFQPRKAVISTLNSSTSTLNTGVAFTGTAEEVTPYDQIKVFLHAEPATADCTLSLQFSSDGTNWDRQLNLSVADPTAEPPHVVTPIARYFRVVLTNGATDNQTALRLQTIYGPAAHGLMSRLTQTLTNTTDVINTRSAIVGSSIGGVYSNVSLDNEGHLEIAVRGPTTAFGEIETAEMTPVSQVKFVNGILAGVATSTTGGSGTTSAADGKATASTTAAANSFGRIETALRGRYRAGQGIRARYTAVFTAGAANSTQVAGLLDAENGWGFGYNGTAFGILHRTAGRREIQTLTVTTGSSHAENITITLDGSALATVAVTNSGSTTTTASEIADKANDYSGLGTEGWDAYASGATVIFVARAARNATGSFTLSGATSAVGTFAETRAGVAPTDSWIAQTAWNIDTLDGDSDASNPSGMTLSPANGNVYDIQAQWLGYGDIIFRVEEPSTGHLVEVHRIAYAGSSTDPSIHNPSLPIAWEARNAANATNIEITTSSGAIFVEGRVALTGPRVAASKAITGVNTSIHHVVSVRGRAVVNGDTNESALILLSLACAVDHTKPMSIILMRGDPTFSASPSWSDLGVTAEVSTTTATITAGTFDEIITIPLGATGQAVINLAELDVRVESGEVLTIAAQTSSGTGGEAVASLTVLQDV